MTTALEERAKIVRWLMCEAFERRFSPDLSRSCVLLAEGIAEGRHYTDDGREDDPHETLTRVLRARAVLEGRQEIEATITKLQSLVKELEDQ